MAIGTMAAIGLGIAGAAKGASAIAGSKAQSKAAEKGADAQVQAAQVAAGAQRQGFVDTTRLQQGRAQAGDTATAQMLQLLGLPVPDSLTSGAAYDSIYSNAGSNGLGGGPSASPGDTKDYFSRYPDVGEEWNRVVANPDALKYLRNQGYPETAAGYAQFHFDKFGASNNLTLGSGEGGSGSGGANAISVPGVSSAEETIRNTPGFQFRMDEGVKAVDSSAVNKGMLLSGGQLKRLQDFGSNYAADEFGRYFDRLSAMSSGGQSATSSISDASQRSASSQANIQQNLGSGLASSYAQQGQAKNNLWQGIGQTGGMIGGGLYGYGT